MGAWSWRAARSAGEAGQLTASARRGQSKAPSISYMEGALLHSARHEAFCRGDTLANVAGPSGRGFLAAVHPSLRAALARQHHNHRRRRSEAAAGMRAECGRNGRD